MYKDFIKKWVGRSLYDDGLVYSLAGRILMFENEETNTDVFLTPKWHGWRDDKQRREFYKDAKRVGVKIKKGTKNEWYKVKDQTDNY